MARKIYFYPTWLRIWHQINAIMFLMLIITGLSMQYGIFSIQFDYAVSIHNACGIILAVNYLIFFTGNFISGNYRHYLIKFKGFTRDIYLQFRFYSFGMFKREKAPFPINEGRKFNPLQKLSYVLIMIFFVPIMIISGLALLFPQVIIAKVFGFPGIIVTDLAHIIAGFICSVFLIVHIYFCTIGAKPTSSFKSIINGYHEIDG